MTGDGRALTRGPVDSQTSLANPLLRWSPDGKRLAGISLPGNRNGSIWIVDPLGSQPSRKLIELPPDTYVRGATWSADGSSLIIGQSRTTGDIILAERSR